MCGCRPPPRPRQGSFPPQRVSTELRAQTTSLSERFVAQSCPDGSEATASRHLLEPSYAFNALVKVGVGTLFSVRGHLDFYNTIHGPYRISNLKTSLLTSGQTFNEFTTEALAGPGPMTLRASSAHGPDVPHPCAEERRVGRGQAVGPGRDRKGRPRGSRSQVDMCT